MSVYDEKGLYKHLDNVLDWYQDNGIELRSDVNPRLIKSNGISNNPFYTLRIVIGKDERKQLLNNILTYLGDKRHENPFLDMVASAYVNKGTYESLKFQRGLISRHLMNGKVGNKDKSFGERLRDRNNIVFYEENDELFSHKDIGDLIEYHLAHELWHLYENKKGLIHNQPEPVYEGSATYVSHLFFKDVYGEKRNKALLDSIKKNAHKKTMAYYLLSLNKYDELIDKDLPINEKLRLVTDKDIKSEVGKAVIPYQFEKQLSFK
jgi:hypothetical protein